jgi:hypothetical protein
MIAFSRLGRMGNLGNQLFEIAGTIGLAHKYGHDCFFPDWQYEKNFKGELCKGTMTNAQLVREQFCHHHDWDTLNKDGLFDLKGWLQSEKYWDRREPQIRKLFTFQEDFAAGVRNRFTKAFERPTIAISTRRGIR